jgi:hypothetical protein
VYGKSHSLRNLFLILIISEQHNFGLVVGGYDGTICFFQISTQLKDIDEDSAPVEEIDERPLDASEWPKIHDGPVADIKESPLEDNIFLSTGGHIFCIFTTQTETLVYRYTRPDFKSMNFYFLLFVGTNGFN